MHETMIGNSAAARRVGRLCLGALPFGSLVDPETSFAILDRFVAAGGTFIDTSNNYSFWVPGCTGGESETVLGDWLAQRDAYEQVLIATKLGALPRTPGAGFEDAEGLSETAIRHAVQGSLKRLGTERIDLLYTHIEDRSVPMTETLGTLASLVSDGTIGQVGASNHRAWRLERARAICEANDWPRYDVLQHRYSYLQPRFDIPLPEGGHMHATPDHLDYVRERNTAGENTTLVVYSALLSGGYTRADKPLSAPYDHPGTTRRLAALHDTAKETGATPNQVVLAWLLGGDPPMLPLVGVSSVRQLDEVLAGVDLTLSGEQRARLNEAA